MINKGVILEIQKNYIIILSKNGQYLKLNRKNGEYISQEIYYTENDILKNKTDYKKLSSIAAVFILCFAIASFLYTGNQTRAFGEEYMVVTVDINPSVEFSFNKENIVRKITPLNQEAIKLVSNEWIGKDFNAVITNYIDAAVDEQYLKEDQTILIGYYSENQSLNQEEMQNNIETIMANTKANNSNIVVINSNEEDLNNARKEEISLGRYEAYKELSQDLNQTMEEVRNEKVTKLVEKLNNKNIKINNKSNSQPQKNKPVKDDSVEEKITPKDNNQNSKPINNKNDNKSNKPSNSQNSNQTDKQGSNGNSNQSSIQKNKQNKNETNKKRNEKSDSKNNNNNKNKN